MITDEHFEKAMATEVANLKCLSRKSAALLLDCNISYIDKLVAARKLEAYKLGYGITRIPLSSIKQFLSSAPEK